MKKTLILAVAVVLALFVAITAAGCVGSEPIVGKWNISALNFPVVFNNDGTGTLHVNLFGTSTAVELKWTKFEGKDKTYNVTCSEAALPAGTYTVSSDGKTLSGPVTLVKAQ
ncbi:MAG: hypothetical protein Q4Q04_00465 [Methanocorpusculum sp.]|nr:hypothetical protein [Methanocorpusculum sp.]